MRQTLFLALLGASCFSLVSAGVMPAEQRVRDTLSASGIKVGVDDAHGRYVFVASADVVIPDPANDPQFMSRRCRLAKVAELYARGDLLKAVRVTANMREQIVSKADGASVSKETEALYTVFAKVDDIRGLAVLSSAESWDAASGLYQVAVAVGWSRNSSDKMFSCKAQDDQGTADADSTYEAWARSVNLACVIGARRFRDPQGRWLCAGVGVADAEGKSGALLKAAIRKAQVQAKANVAFAVRSDEACREVAQMRMVERENANTASADADELFVSQVERKAGAIPLRAHEVYSTLELKHPVTGRRMCVSVYGIEPVDAANAM